MPTQGRRSRFAQWRDRPRAKCVEKGLKAMKAEKQRVQSGAAGDQHRTPRDHGSGG